METETQSCILTNGLVGLARDADPSELLGELMRAAHSLKGAARIVGRNAAVRIAHAMEDCLVALQTNRLTISESLIDTLLEGVDLLNRIAQVSDESLDTWEGAQQREIETFLISLSSLAVALDQHLPAIDDLRSSPPPQSDHEIIQLPQAESPSKKTEPFENAKDTAASADRMLRVTADNLNRLMGIAGEALVTSRWVDAFGKDMLRLKRFQFEIDQSLQAMRDSFPEIALNEQVAEKFGQLRDRTMNFQKSLTTRLLEFDLFDRRFASFSTRLYHEVLQCRMRPFADGIQGLHRMVRDVGRALGKTVKLEIVGESTPVDRDILERLKAPLDHLLRNAIDHGIELPADRQLCGKPEQGTLRLEACHSAGMLLITVADDGRGVDPEAIRKTVVHRKLSTLETAQKMTNAELFEFLFLPAFTLKEQVSEISGRGVGLDVVQTMLKEVGGRVRISSRSGLGTGFQLELPLTLSVIRTLLAEIAGEPYAFPLARIDRALKLPKARIESLEGRQHFSLGDEQIGLVAVHQVLDLKGSPLPGDDVCVIVMGEKATRYGLVVDRFLGERELVVRPLDARLGKVTNISSAALMPDGSPVLIVDIDDFNRSVESLVSDRRLSRVRSETSVDEVKKRKQVLVVDDSLTVRELERKLLDSRGYAVDVAVDGMDGWNAVRTGHYDLVLTDVDMPRLDGFELIKLIRKDHRLKSLPVMIVSYKDRPEDRSRGLEAGADYYLTKASFHDETLLGVVADLIGASGL